MKSVIICICVSPVSSTLGILLKNITLHGFYNKNINKAIRKINKSRILILTSPLPFALFWFISFINIIFFSILIYLAIIILLNLFSRAWALSQVHLNFLIDDFFRVHLLIILLNLFSRAWALSQVHLNFLIDDFFRVQAALSSRKTLKILKLFGLLKFTKRRKIFCKQVSGS